MARVGFALFSAIVAAGTVAGCASGDPTPAPSTPSTSASSTAHGDAPVVLAIGKPIVVGAVTTTVEQVQAHFGADRPTYQPQDPKLEWLGVLVRTCVAPKTAPAGPLGWYQFTAVDAQDSWYPALTWSGSYPLPSSEWPLPRYPSFAQVPAGDCAAGWLLVPVPRGGHVAQVDYASPDGKLRAAWQVS